MSKFTKFLALSGRDRLLLAEAFAVLAFFRVALHLVAIDRLRAWASRGRSGDKPLERIVWAVRTAARSMPGATCLCSALTLQRMLSAQGRPSELHIGVTRERQGIAAHAWLVHDGRVLIGEDEQDRYTILTTWQAGGLESR